MNYILCQKEVHREEHKSDQAKGWPVRSFTPTKALRFTERPSRRVPGFFPRDILWPGAKLTFPRTVRTFISCTEPISLCCTQLCNFLWFRLNTLFQSTIPRLLKEVAGVCFVIDKWWGLEKGAAAAFPGGGCFSSSFNLPPHDAVYFYAHKSLPHTLSTRILPLVFFLYFFPPPLHVI